MAALDTDITIDALEQELIACERVIGKLRARQVEIIRSLDEAQVATADGARSMVEWTASRVDVDPDVARTLVNAAALFAEHPEIAGRLEAGSTGFDRAVATARLAAAGASHETLAASERYDLAGLRRVAARHRRLTKRTERETFKDRFFATQFTLDGTAGRGWFRLAGFELRLLEDAIDLRADMFRDLPGPTAPAGTRRADALVSVAQDSLEPPQGMLVADTAGYDDTPPLPPARREPLVTVFVDAALAAETNGEAGVEVAAGAKAGPATLERILCGGAVQLVGLYEGTPVTIGRTTRAIAPAVRRAVLWRDGGCTIDGCGSRYRLEPHHVVPWASGGSHDAENLTTLCWYHHHVAIHGEGHWLDQESPPGRRRFTRKAAPATVPP